jgi:hypothetical protein
VAGHIAVLGCVLIVMLGVEQVELVIGLGMSTRTRQFFEDRVKAHLRVVDLGRQRIAFGLLRIAFFAKLFELGARSVAFGVSRCELRFE